MSESYFTPKSKWGKDQLYFENKHLCIDNDKCESHSNYRNALKKY